MSGSDDLGGEEGGGEGEQHQPGVSMFHSTHNQKKSQI